MIPNLFSKANIPVKLPKSMQAVIEQLKKSRNREECLKKAYDILTKKFKGCRWYTSFFDLFVKNVFRLWKKNGHLHCHNLNYLLRILLVKSGFFKDEEIKLKLTFIRPTSLHQYLNIRINAHKSINADPWGKVYGTKFGDYTKSF